MSHASLGRGVGGAIAALVLVGACASTTTTNWTPGQIAAAENAISTARAAGADQDEQAARHLRLAEEQLAAARERITAGETRDAAWLLARATADAELSQTLQQEASISNEARVSEQQLEQTRASSVPVSAPMPAPATTVPAPSTTVPAPSTTVPAPATAPPGETPANKPAP